jgi:hypothetical protein
VHGDTRGAALLEVLAAVAIMGFAGTALLEVTTSQTRAAAESRKRNTELQDEERLLTGYALLTRVDLERRLGSVAVGPYHVEVQRPEPALFRLSISRSSTPAVEDLVTVVFRDGSGAR